MKSRQPRAAPSKSSACAGQGGAGGLEEKGDREITSRASATRPEISPAVRAGLAGDTTAPTAMSA